MIVVSLLAATICFADECHPALIGKTTPVGQFELNQRLTSQPGYGGDVLQFSEDSTSWNAIHRVYLLNKNERRDKRLLSSNPKDRIITKGCINVAPDVYKKLVDCCSSDGLIIQQ